MLRTILATASLALTLIAAPAHAGEATAMETFQKSHDTVIALVKKDANNETIQREIDAFLDYSWIAQQSLGGPKRFQKRCEPRCEEFEALLTRLIRSNYLKRIHQSDNGSIEYVGEELRRNGTKAKVDTTVRFKKNGKDQEIEISYVMHKTDQGWVCRNIITDGVSLAKTYRFEFNKVLRDEGIDGLIARLETKLNEVAKAG